MRITATNGNARNGIKGQRVTFTARSGASVSVNLSAGNGLRRRSNWPVLERWARWGYLCDISDRLPRAYGPFHPVRAMADLFAASKARLSIRHNRRFP